MDKERQAEKLEKILDERKSVLISPDGKTVTIGAVLETPLTDLTIIVQDVLKRLDELEK
jgi:hypothetical protein